VSLIRLGAVTHAFDQNQRFQRLSFTANATGLTVTAPSSATRTPPGHYMVFILNGDDVPSVARIVRIF
jgi:galactose oxidase